VRLTTAVAWIIRDIIAGALAQKRYVPQSDWESAATGAAPDEFMHPKADDAKTLRLLDDVFGETKVSATYRNFLEARAEELVEDQSSSRS
jgi:hypothetical protein